MIAIAGGLSAAVLWATATLLSSRSTRMIGSWSVLGWVMVVGLAVGLPFAVVDAPQASLTRESAALATFAGLGYVVGLGTAYRALQLGKVSVVTPIVATEGALAAVFAVVLGEPLAALAGVVLALVAVGVVLSTLERRPGPDYAGATADDRRATILAICAAVAFSFGLVGTGLVADLLPVTWVATSARLVGVVLIALPLLVTGRLRMSRRALPFILVAGACELLGSIAWAIGGRESIPVTAVLGSQFAAIAVVVGYLAFGERLGRIQVAGVGIVLAGVSALAWIQA
jgi:drug/metabolite transporter (DMT)-like permease